MLYKLKFVSPCDCGDIKISLISAHDASFIAVNDSLDLVAFTLSNRPQGPLDPYSFTESLTVKAEYLDSTTYGSASI